MPNSKFRTPLVESLESRVFMHAGHDHAFAASINFQPAGVPVPPGYLEDVGAPYGPRANGLTYGWTVDAAPEARDRNSTLSPDQRYDTLIHLRAGWRWALKVPNGQYHVTIVSGDANHFDSVFKTNVESMLVVNAAPTTSSRWVTASATVTVSDGNLSLTNASGASNNKLCFVEVFSVDPVEPPPPPPPATTIPAAPTALDAFGAGTSTIKLKWTDNAGNETGYKIERRLGDSGTYRQFATVGANVTTFTDSGLAPYTRYVYRVRAYNGSGNSAFSNVDGTRTTSVPGNSITWTTRASSPIVRAESLRAVVDGKLYVLGGFSGNAGPVTRSDVYDPVANTWTRIADMPTRLTHAGTAVIGREIIVAGGYIGLPHATNPYHQQFGVRDVRKFNVDTQTWSTIPLLPKAVAGGGLVALGRELHYFSGNDSLRKDVGDHYVLNLDNLAAGWKTAVSLPTARSHFGYVALGGKIYAIGGQTGNDSLLVTKSDVHVWDPANPIVWTRKASIPRPVSHISASTFV